MHSPQYFCLVWRLPTLIESKRNNKCRFLGLNQLFNLPAGQLGRSAFDYKTIEALGPFHVDWWNPSSAKTLTWLVRASQSKSQDVELKSRYGP